MATVATEGAGTILIFGCDFGGELTDFGEFAAFEKIVVI